MVEMPHTNALDAGKSTEQLLAERSARIADALALKVPDRIPVSASFGYFISEYAGVPHQVQLDDPDVNYEITAQVGRVFQPDVLMGAWNSKAGAVVLGDRMVKFPGYGLPADSSFQFDEKEFMTVDDYEPFLRDPSDWIVRTYLPRAFAELEGLASMPPLGMFGFGHYNVGNLPFYANPAVKAALAKLDEASAATAEGTAAMLRNSAAMADLGFPPPMFAGSLIEAPFDFMSDTLRGMRGILTDIHRRPEQLLEAQQRVLEIETEFALMYAEATGLKAAFIPLHRGSDGFMSLPHFERFYWPQLRELMDRLLAHGITPFPFYEGTWEQRLDYLAELPVGKTVGMFQATDIGKVKDKVGSVMCIHGGMPNSLLVGGTVESVREHTRRVCEVAGEGGGVIMSTEVAEMEGSKPELVAAWIDATREFGVY